MTIKWKMTLWYTLLMLLITAVVLGVMLYMSRTVAESRAQDILETVVNRNAEWVWFYQGRLQYSHLPTYDEGVYLQLCWDDGTVWAGFSPFLIDPEELEDGAMRQVAYEGGTLYLYSVRVWDEEALFRAEAASGEPGAASDEPTQIAGVWLCGIISAESLDNVVSSVVRLACIALPVLMLLALLGGWIIASRTLAPVRKITAAAQDISGGDDLSRRIELGDGHDEMHTLADTFNAMFARLERSFLAERQFTSDASHELRTPTAVILVECDTAKKLENDPAELRQSIDVIERQTKRMSALIAKLLLFTRLEQGTQKIESGTVCLSELAEVICEEQAMIAEKNITIEKSIRENVRIAGDEYLLMSLIQNLISNARKYGRENGHIWVELSRDDELAWLIVRDDGIGIAPEELPKIWNRFYRSDASRTNRDGSLGLGLAMCREIARLHRGEITAESEPGVGSTFIFSAPIAETK